MYFTKIKFFFLLASILFLMMGISSCEKNNEEEVKEVTTDKVILPAESGKNIEIIYSDSAKIAMKLTAPFMDRYAGEKPYSEFVKGLKLIQYDKDEVPTTQIVCNYALDHTDEDWLEAKDDVIVINKKGEKLTTEHLIWDKKNHKIRTEEFVTITTKDETIYGYGLESEEDFSEYKIKNVTGIIQIDEDDEEL